MGYRKRIIYTESQKALMWDRWRKRESLQQIAQLSDRNHSSVSGILSVSGGIRPPQRKRGRNALSLAEREEISRAMVAGESIRTIAKNLGRSPSTISRELSRNGGPEYYRASDADQAAWDRAHRPKPCQLLENRYLARLVAAKLRQQWSPQQIAGWLKHSYPDDVELHVSHETIYKTLLIQTRLHCFSAASNRLRWILFTLLPVDAVPRSLSSTYAQLSHLRGLGNTKRLCAIESLTADTYHA